MGFKIGDRVETTKDFSGFGLSIRKGMMGKVCAFGSTIGNIGVEFDTDVGGHHCNHNCKYGYGYFIEYSMLKYTELGFDELISRSINEIYYTKRRENETIR